MSKGAKPERGWVVELRDVNGDWFMLQYTFHRTRSETIDEYLVVLSTPEHECLACLWREKQHDYAVRCVRVVLSEANP